MKTMKKIVCALMTLVLLLSSVPAVFADEAKTIMAGNIRCTVCAAIRIAGRLATHCFPNITGRIWI